MKTILEYLKHESTWRGIIALLTSLGIAIQPEMIEALIATGLSLIGLINILKED